MKVAINSCFGNFSLSEEAYKHLGLEWDKYGTEFNEDSLRDDPKLIECIEKLGKAANGKDSFIKIVEVPDDVKWYISNDDGIEVVHELHRTWC